MSRMHEDPTCRCTDCQEADGHCDDPAHDDLDVLREQVRALTERVAHLERLTKPESIDTWKAIAGFLNRSERWCRYMAAQQRPDPLPVYKMGGLVQMNLQQYSEWLERQKTKNTGVAA